MAQDPTFCPICGAALTQREEGGRLRPACDNCGYIHYVNPVPGVGLIIEMDGGVVLIKRGAPPHKDEWTLPSGFVEADESAEEAAVREAEEETGLKVEIVEMMGINSFPEGPPVSGIMIFYRMKPVAGDLRAGDDASDVAVFQPADLPLLPFRTHREMMGEWLERFASGARPQSAHDEPPERAAFDVRPARVEDLEEIIGLLMMIPANRDLTRDDFAQVAQRFRESPTLHVFVAQTLQTPPLIIGFVAMTVVRSLTEGRGFINDMAVLPAFQRRGVGAELLEAVIRRATDLNLSAVMVNAQRANDQVRAFYAALGFDVEDMLRLKIR